MSDKNPIEEYRENFLERLAEPTIGDIFYYDGGTFYRVEKIHKNGSVKCAQSMNGIDWTPADKRFDLDDIRRYYKKLPLANGETAQEAIQSLLAELAQALLDPSVLESPDEEENSSTALIPLGGKGMYEQMAIEMNRLKSRADIIADMAKERMQRISHIAYALQERLHKVMRVLGILEVYLGVHEKIFQLTEGQPAGIDEPLCFRQRILYMDEEAAIVRVFHSRHGIGYEGDINHASVDIFDQWLLEPGHLDYILPEKKGVIALRASRQKRYDDLDLFSKIRNEQEDKMVYLLVRNGDNLYRVWTNLVGGETLFPTSADSEKIAELFSEEFQHRRDEGEKKQAGWITNTLLVQGLVDRTQVFHPLPNGRVDLSDPNTYADGGPVRLIRDAENLIADGHESFDDWMRRINQTAKRGTRIYFSGLPFNKDGHRERFDVWQNYYPDIPNPGLFTVEEVDEGRRYGKCKIFYLPTDSTYWRVNQNQRDGSWEDDTQRTRRYGFWLYYDEFINYDEIDLASLDYFLQSRDERRNYRELMPLLISIRDMRIKELAEERGFVELLSKKHSIPEARLWELVEWWKRKVINRRPIAQDDAKAWRMIVREARREQNA